jgi:hypothetical protein
LFQPTKDGILCSASALSFLDDIEADLPEDRNTENPFTGPWDFLSRACWTKDEASGQVRQFPAALMHEGQSRFDYLRYCTEERPNHRIRAYEKSRRMMVTWWLLALYLYDIMTEPNHANAIASDKLLKSAYLLGPERMEFVYNAIPADVWPDKPTVRFEHKESMGWQIAHCEQTGSYCMAVASGQSQMQQYTFSNVLMDEFPRWKWQEESWRNIQPTTQGGGCVDIVCTAELGVFAYDLLYDRVERLAG